MIHQTATIEDTVYFWFAANDTSGSGADGATPLFDVREAGAAAGAAPLLSGTPTLLSHVNYPAGCHEIAVAATTGNGFAADDTFAVFCTLLVDSQNPSGFVGSCTLTPLAKASQLDNLSNVGSAVNTDPSSYTLTTGTQSSGTVASVSALDGTNHEHTDTAGAMDLYYEFSIGSGLPASVTVTGYLNGNNDDLEVQGYDWVAAGWVQIGTLSGKIASVNEVNSYDLFVNMVGSGANEGLVRVRFTDGAFTLTTATLAIDQIFLSFSRGSEGYDNGSVWLDTTVSNTNTVVGVDGVARNPVSTIAAANTLIASTNLNRLEIAPGSTITLAATQSGQLFQGHGWTLALGGQDVDNSHFFDAEVSGIATAATEMEFHRCEISTASLQKAHCYDCTFDGTVTMTLAGDYQYHNCRSGIAGPGSAVFTKTAGQAITAQWRNWMDSITVSGLQSGDTITINGRLGTVTLNGADATVEIRGSYKAIVNNLTGSPTVNTAGAWQGSDIADILADTGTTGVLLDSTATSAQLVDDIWDEPLTKAAHDVSNSAGRRLRNFAGYVIRADTAQGPGTGNNQIQFDTGASAVDGAYDPAMVAIIDGTGPGQTRLILEYDGTTKTATVDRNWKVNPDATSEFIILAHPGREHVNEGLAQAGGANTITLNALASATDDAYVAQVVFIRSGTGEDQSGTIIAYNGTTKVAIIDKPWAVVPDSTSGYIMIPNDHVILANTTHTGAVIPGVAALNDISVADILTTALTESYAADGAAPTLSQALFAIMQQAGEFSIAGTTITVKKLDGSTTAMTFTLNDATNPTSRTRAT
jgi:hypothetical protein